MEESHRRKTVAESLGAAAPTSAKAQRACFNASAAGRLNFAAGKELVGDYEKNNSVVEKIPAKDLPEELAKMTKEQLAGHLAEKSAERKRIQKEIRELADKRQAFIQKELARTKGKKEASLEYKTFHTIKKQAADNGLAYEADDAVY